jgi:hypothetical protein
MQPAKQYQAARYGGSAPGKAKKKKRSLYSRILAELGRFRRRRAVSSTVRQINNIISRDANPRIAIRLRGGIGDHIVGARFLRDLQAAAGHFDFDVYTPRIPVASWLLSNFPGYKSCYYDQYLWRAAHRDYPLALEVNQLFLPVFETADWIVISRRFPKLAEICHRACEQLEALEPCARYHPFLDGHLARVAVFMGAARYNFLHKLCGIEYGGDRLSLKIDECAAAKFGLAGKRYITISNGFDAFFNSRTERATKVYPHSESLARLIKSRFPELTIVQIGSDTSVPLPPADLNLINSTSLSEAAALLKHAEVHIDSEGGLVHIAACVGTKSCVLFGPTGPDYFGYPGNINIGPATCGNCYWINSTWMNGCIKGFDKPACLDQLAPAGILEHIADELQSPAAIWVRDTAALVKN